MCVLVLGRVVLGAGDKTAWPLVRVPATAHSDPAQGYV